MFLALPFVLGGIFPLILGMSLGLGSPAVPIAIIGEGCAYWAVHVQALLGKIKRDRQEEVKKAGDISRALE